MSALVVGVYRARNAAVIGELLAQARERGLEARLWALDEPVAALEEWTLGSGPGGKFALVNRLLAAGEAGERELVVVDDDFRFTRGSLGGFLDVMRRCGFDLAQPAHDRRSYWMHPITRAERFSVARETTFVEIGPIFAVSPAWRPRIAPFPEIGMGWGLEVEWFRLQQEGCRLGVVDRARIRHLAPVAETYDTTAEREREEALLAAHGLESYADLQHTLRQWRPWSPLQP